MMSKINFFYSREQGHSLPIPIICSPLPDNDLISTYGLYTAINPSKKDYSAMSDMITTSLTINDKNTDLDFCQVMNTKSRVCACPGEKQFSLNRSI